MGCGGGGIFVQSGRVGTRWSPPRISNQALSALSFLCPEVLSVIVAGWLGADQGAAVLAGGVDAAPGGRRAGAHGGIYGLIARLLPAAGD